MASASAAERESLLARDGKDADGELARDATPTEKKSDGRTETLLWIKVLSMVSYLVLQVAGTIFASLSRNSDDDYPYDTSGAGVRDGGGEAGGVVHLFDDVAGVRRSRSQ